MCRYCSRWSRLFCKESLCPPGTWTLTSIDAFVWVRGKPAVSVLRSENTGRVDGSWPLVGTKRCLLPPGPRATSAHTAWPVEQGLYFDPNSLPIQALCDSQTVQSRRVAPPSILTLILLLSSCHDSHGDHFCLTHSCRLSVPTLEMITC